MRAYAPSVLPLGFCAFVLFGLGLVLPGASQDALATAFDLDLTRTGLLAAVLSLGIGVGVLSGGPLVDRVPRRPLFVGATLLAAGALLGVDADAGFARLLGRVGALGLGLGIYDTLLNAVCVERYGSGAARRLLLLHAGASIGAVGGPPLVGALDSVGGWSLAFRAAGACFLVLAVAAVAVPLGRPVRPPRRTGPAPRVLSPALAALCIVGFAYVGIEGAVTVFAVPYADHLGLSPARGRVGISAFWVGLLLGRMGLAARGGTLGTRVLAWSGAVAGLGLLLGAALELRWIELLLAAVGLALGGVFPVMIALAGQQAPQARGTATGLVAGAGAAGGFVVPWLTGALGDRTGLTAAIAALAAWCAVITLAALHTRRTFRRGTEFERSAGGGIQKGDGAPGASGEVRPLPERGGPSPS